MCNIKRLYPFDTGAYFNSRMDNLVHPGINLENFELRPNIDSAKQVVGAFYGSNSKYLDCDPSNDIDLEELVKNRMHTVEAYHQLIRHVPNDGTDERIHSIEVQLDNNINLKNNVLAVVVPHRFVSPEEQKLIEISWECKVIGYNIKAVYSPADLMTLLFDKIRTVLLEDDQI